MIGEGFQRARGTTEYFALDVFLRDGERVFLTYVGERVRVGQTVKMHVRDGASADEDLRGALRAGRRSRPPAG